MAHILCVMYLVCTVVVRADVVYGMYVICDVFGGVCVVLLAWGMSV